MSRTSVQLSLFLSDRFVSKRGLSGVVQVIILGGTKFIENLKEVP